MQRLSCTISSHHFKSYCRDYLVQSQATTYYRDYLVQSQATTYCNVRTKISVFEVAIARIPKHDSDFEQVIFSRFYYMYELQNVAITKISFHQFTRARKISNKNINLHKWICIVVQNKSITPIIIIIPSCIPHLVYTNRK